MKWGCPLQSVFLQDIPLLRLNFRQRWGTGQGLQRWPCPLPRAPGRKEGAERLWAAEPGLRPQGSCGSRTAAPRPCGRGRWLAALSLCFLFREVSTHTPASRLSVSSKGDRAYKGRHAVPAPGKHLLTKAALVTVTVISRKRQAGEPQSWDSNQGPGIFPPPASAHSDPH